MKIRKISYVILTFLALSTMSGIDAMVNLGSYDAMIVGKYLEKKEDFLNLESVCKKFSGNNGKYYLNPMAMSLQSAKKFFPNICTFCVYNYFAGKFITDEKLDEINSKSPNPVTVVEYRPSTYTFEDIKSIFEEGKCGSKGGGYVLQNVEVIGDKPICRKLILTFDNGRYQRKYHVRFGSFFDFWETSDYSDDLKAKTLCVRKLDFNIFKQFEFINYVIRKINKNNSYLNLNEINVREFAKLDEAKNVIKEIIFPEGIKKIGYVNSGDKFDELDENLERIVLPEGVKSIGERALSESCHALREINLPDSLESIGWGAFEDCFALEKIKIPDKVKNLSGSTFFRCLGLSEVTLPKNLEFIGDYCFQQCKMEEIKLPNTLKYIGGNAFSICKNLKEIEIPDSVEFLGKDAFCACDELEKATLPKGLEDVKRGLFSGCGKLKKIHIPDNVKSIGQYAFSYCHSLEEISIPHGLREIDAKAFEHASIKKVYVRGGSLDKKLKQELQAQMLKNKIQFIENQ